MLFGECGNWISVGSIIYRSSLQWALDECHPSESALSPAINLCIFVEVACLSSVCVETKRKKIIKIKTIRNQKWHALKCVGRIFFHIIMNNQRPSRATVELWQQLLLVIPNCWKMPFPISWKIHITLFSSISYLKYPISITEELAQINQTSAGNNLPSW